MTKKQNVLIFTGMYAEKYGAFERYNVELVKHLVKNNYNPIVIYNNECTVKDYLDDLITNKATYVILKPNNSLKQLIKDIKNLIKQYNPEIVHTHFNPKIVRLVCYIAFLNRVPKRYNTFHGMAQSTRWFTKIWMYSLSLLNTKQFAISEAIRNQQISVFKSPKKKIITLRLGLDSTIFKTNLTKDEIKEKYKLPKDGILIGNVAFHNPIKGIDILLEAFALSKNKVTEKIYLCQIGSQSNNYTSQLLDKAKELNISDQIIWMGVQNEVPELLKAFDIYVQPSRSEGLALAILEAYFAKLPVIASNVGGIPEIVDSKKGKLFEVEDSNTLAKYIIELVENKNIRIKKGNYAHNYISNTFNLKKQVQYLVNFYNN